MAITWYLNMLLLVISLVGMFIVAKPGARWGTLTWSTYGMIILLAFGMVIMGLNRLIAVKHLTTNRMSVFMQMELLLQIAIDVFFLGKTFKPV